jgi:hypothetical protein
MSISLIRPCLTALTTLSLVTMAHALTLTENIVGTLSADTTLGGIALGTPTPFAITATFQADPSANLNPDGAPQAGLGPYGIYPITAFQISIPDHGGIYNGVKGSSLNALVGLIPMPVIGLSNGGLTSFVVEDYIEPYPLNFKMPTPTGFEYPVGSYAKGPAGGYQVDLIGVPGGLNLHPFFSVSYASIADVPEPNQIELAALGLALGAFALAWRTYRMT